MNEITHEFLKRTVSRLEETLRENLALRVEVELLKQKLEDACDAQRNP